MHTYRIEAYLMNPDGTQTQTLAMTKYADSHEQARLLFYELYNQYQEEEQTDSEGNVTTVRTNVKKYKVRLHILCYHQHENPVEYFAQYQQ